MENSAEKELHRLADKLEVTLLRVKIDALSEALVDMLKVQRMLMPGVRYIAVEDYALLNDAPLRAVQALKLASE